jgi:hypothetical protein
VCSNISSRIWRRLEKVYSPEEIEKLLSNPHFLNKQRSVRRTIRKGPEIVKLLQAVVIQYQESGLFLKDGLNRMAGMYASIRNYVCESVESSAVWVNTGTVQEPIWLACRGTGLCENYHRYNNSLNIWRYDYPTANSMYVASLYRYSHRQRVNRVGLDLMEFLLDPTLANDIVLLQRELASSIRFKPILTGHKVLEKVTPDKYTCGLAISNPVTSVTKSFASFMQNLEDYDHLVPYLGNPDYKCLNKPEQAARAFSRDEFPLIRHLLSTPDFLTEAGKRALSPTKQVTDLLKKIVDHGVAKYVQHVRLATHWNCLFYDCIEYDFEEFHVDDSHSIAFSLVTPKTELHMTNGIKRFAEDFLASSHKAANPLLKVSVSVTSGPVSETHSTTAGSGVLQIIQTGDVVAPPMILAETRVDQVNQTPYFRTNSSQPALCQIVSRPKKHARLQCVGCDKKRHSAGDPSPCGFRTFVEEEEQRNLGIDHPLKVRQLHANPEMMHCDENILS